MSITIKEYKCPICGSRDLYFLGRKRFRNGNYINYRCCSCGATGEMHYKERFIGFYKVKKFNSKIEEQFGLIDLDYQVGDSVYICNPESEAHHLVGCVSKIKYYQDECIVTVEFDDGGEYSPYHRHDFSSNELKKYVDIPSDVE